MNQSDTIPTRPLPKPKGPRRRGREAPAFLRPQAMENPPVWGTARPGGTCLDMERTTQRKTHRCILSCKRPKSSWRGKRRNARIRSAGSAVGAGTTEQDMEKVALQPLPTRKQPNLPRGKIHFLPRWVASKPTLQNTTTCPFPIGVS